jgi:DNA-binding NarL/FixJ family response regulator
MVGMVSEASDRTELDATTKSTGAVREERPISLFIIGNVRLHREALAHLFGDEGSIKVLGADESDAALERIRDTTPDVVLVDVVSRDGVDAIRALAKVHPSCKALAFGIAEVESEVLECTEAGALGYVSREASFEEAVRAIRGAERAEAICSPRMTAMLLRRLRALATEQATATQDANLTMREIEVLRLINRGLSNKEIAELLSIALATVKNHVHNILQKLDLHRRAQATAWLRRGSSFLPG